MQTAVFPALAEEEMVRVVAEACAGFLELSDPREILDHLAKMLRRAVAHETLVIFEADWSRLELRPALVVGDAVAAREPALPLGAGAAGRVFLRGQHHGGSRSLLVPLVSGPRRLGVLELRRRKGEGFGASDVERCATLAGLAATAWRRSEERARLEQRVFVDAKTGLLNRRWWDELAAREARQAARSGSGIGVLYVDLDDFEKIGQAVGQATADTVLSYVGRLLRSVVDAGDAVVRLDGDDLVVLLRDCDARHAAEVAEEVLLAVPAAAGATAPGLTASVGLAMFPEHGETLQAVLAAAETAMRSAKAAGKDRLVAFQPSGPGGPRPPSPEPASAAAVRADGNAGAAHRAALSQLEEEHRRLVEAQYIAMIGSFEMDLATGRLEWSPELRRIVGIAADESPSPEGVMDRVHPEDVESYTAAIRDWVDDRSSGVQHTFRIVRDDGSTRHVQVRLGARRREDGHRVVSGTLQDVTERVEIEQARRIAEEQLYRLRLEDPLTGLPNRQLLDDRLDQSLRRARRTGTALTVLLLDVDSFKRINDSLGRAAGDRLLVQLARRLALGLGAGDTAARLSGDEFVVVHEGVGTAEQAQLAGSRLLASLAEPFVLGGDGDETFVTASCGVVVTSGGQPAEDVLRDAEAAMYAAKSLGGGRIVLFDESMRRRPSGRLAMEAALRRAIERRELVVNFQPVVRLADDALVGVEALARWPRPGLAPVGPSEFVPIAEAIGLIDQLGDCVLDAALRQVAVWRREVPEWHSLFVAVNLSPLQLLASDLPHRCRAALERHGLPAQALRLEVTEEALVEEAGRSASILREITDSGIAIAMDDFGTGFSSLSRLKQLPVSTLKIDRSFVDGLGSDPSDSSIVRAIVGLGHALGLELCAEGVEMPHQRDHLAELGCHHAQGFLWAQPLPAEELTRVLAPHRGRVPPHREGDS